MTDMAPQNDYKRFFQDVTTKLQDSLFSPNFCNNRLLNILETIPPFISPLTRINWNLDFENLVNMLRLCIVYNDPKFNYLFYLERSESDLSVTCGLQMSAKASDVLNTISERISGKESYGFLDTMIVASRSESFKFKDLFTFSVNGDAELSDYISYSHVINLMKSIVNRAKSLLSCAESRKTNQQLFDPGSVAFTSLSLDLADTLKELLELGLQILKYHNFRQTEGRLDLDTVGSFTFEIANACPFDRLDPNVFKNLSDYIVKYHMSRPKLHARKTFTSLFTVLMKYDPEISDNMTVLLDEKPLFNSSNATKNTNSIIVDCYRSITIWLSSIHVNSPYIIDHSLTAESDLKLLSTLCKTKAFSEILFQENNLLLRLVVSILQASPLLEKNHLKGKYGPSVFDKPDIAAKMAPVTDSTNLLCMLVKLCSQKVTETPTYLCHEEDEDGSYAPPPVFNLNDFVALWTQILELMPVLVESQVSSIPNGILNSIAEFGESLFNLLKSTNLQRKIITTVLIYCSSSMKSEIRAKAGRALARLIEFRCLTEDFDFSMNAFDAILLNMSAPELSVRTTFSWAFGNWSDIYLQDCLSFENEKLPVQYDQMITDFHFIIKKSCGDKAKVKYNIFRGAGNLLKHAQTMNGSQKTKIMEVVFILVGQVGRGFDFKARWNACCALRTVFTNQCLFRNIGEEVVDRTMQCFVRYMCQSENFKERVQCVVGVGSLKSRADYGDYFIILWDKVINASMVEPPDLLSEVGQAEKLKLEVGRTYIHLISLLLKTDLQALEEVINTKWENISDVVKFASGNIPMDDLSELESAICHLEVLMKLPLRVYEMELCRTLYWALHRRSFE